MPKGERTKLPRTAAALKVYDAGFDERERMVASVETNKDVFAWQAACEEARQLVQDAFYEDCIATGIPNSRDHCSLVSIAILRKWSAESADGKTVDTV